MVFETTTKGGAAVVKLAERILEAILKDPRIWGILVAVGLIAFIVGDVRASITEIRSDLADHITHQEASAQAQTALMTTLIQLTRQILNVTIQECIDKAEGENRSAKVRRCLAASSGIDPQ